MSSFPGVSVLICCHNSAQRLPTTLKHLAAQVGTDDIEWEVIVVDNASMDGTSSAALAAWPSPAPASLRVVAEPQIGLMYARVRALSEARYPILLYVDDDNWLCPDYVSVTSAIMREQPEVAICNGYASAAFEGERPAWFEQFKSSYAVSNPDWPSEDVTSLMPVPFGAGMAVRKTALDRLQESGFQALLTGRQGKNITSGDDTEICLALRLAGWRWWRDKRLTFQHFIPNGRARWQYCLRLARGGGAAYAMLDLYEMAFGPQPSTLFGRLRETWWWAAKWSMQRIIVQHRALLRLLTGHEEGDRAVFRLVGELGKLQSLFTNRADRTKALARLRQAPWIQRDEPR